MIPPVIICRQYLPGTADDLAQGHKLGYACAVCKRRLQATNTGARQIAAGAWPLCNQCQETQGNESGTMKATFEVITPDLETLQRILQAVRDVEQTDPARIHLRILTDEEALMHERRWLDMMRKVEPPLPEEFMLRWKK